MSLVKKQHYVPQSYLRNFGFIRKEKSKNIWYTHVKFEKTDIQPTNIENLCNERFLYDVENFELPEKQIIEKFYAKNIDSYFPLITNFCNNPKQQTLSSEMREIMVTCCLSLIFRHPNFINSNPKFFGEDIIIEKKEKKINYSKIKRVSAHMQNFKKIVDAKMNDGIAVSICDHQIEFITNDNPVVITNGNKVTSKTSYLDSIFDPSNMIYLPLTPKICLTFTPTVEADLQGTFQRTLMSTDQTFYINQKIEEQSKRALIGTQQGLKYFFKKKQHYSKRENQAEFVERIKSHTEVVLELLNIAQEKGPASDELEDFFNAKLLEFPALKEDKAFMSIRLQMLIARQHYKANKQKEDER